MTLFVFFTGTAWARIVTAHFTFCDSRCIRIFSHQRVFFIVAQLLLFGQTLGFFTTLQFQGFNLFRHPHLNLAQHADHFMLQ
ncbi:hypothetical protein D3C72_1218420 [compost metagenome]